MAEEGVENTTELFVDDTDEEELRAQKRRRSLDEIGPVPTEADKIPEVSDWYLSTVKPDDPYMCPSLGVGILCGGSVKHHPHLPDGDSISTTPLLYLIGTGPEKAYAKTVNRWYRLMQPEEGYVKFIEEGGKKIWFPDGLHQNHNRTFKRKTNGDIQATVLDE
jgi:hypothetical protein